MPEKMQIEPNKGYLHVQVSGVFNFRKAKDFIRQIIKAMKHHDLFNAIVDIRKIEGSIPVISRFELGTFLSRELTVPMRMAVLESPGQVESYKFFEHVTANRGSLVKVFINTIDEALEWFKINASQK